MNVSRTYIMLSSALYLEKPEKNMLFNLEKNIARIMHAES